MAKKKESRQEFVPPKTLTKSVEVKYNDDTGNWHVWLCYPNGDRIEVAQHSDEGEAEQAADDINRFAQGY